LKPLTFEQFLDWERGQEQKHEFVDGELRGSGCRVFPSDMLVRTGQAGVATLI
jgi:hypothetical protein